MGVNSALKDFFNNRLPAASGIAITMSGIFLITSSFTIHPDRDLRAKQVNVIIRQIGHQLLLQAGDSTSRVLPVTEIKEGTFLLKFENELAFSHDALLMLTQDLLPKTQFPSGYTVTVQDCIKSGIVYGFLINNISPDILPCRGRSEPRGCYTIEIAFPDLYEDVGQKKADIAQQPERPKPSKVAPEKPNPKLKESRPVELDHQEARPFPSQAQGKLLRDRLTLVPEPAEGLKLVNPKLEELNTITFDYPLISLVGSGMLVLLSVTLLIGRFGKSSVPVPNQEHLMVKESVPQASALGKFLFDVKDQCLLLGSEMISLTDKESRILELLYKNFGELIPRETLMQEVWINEGVITGRSLDMFISKLRKKLSRDPQLRITNVHGKGYKLEIPETQIL